MKIAVTGATGFIGRHVVAELERRGHAVVLLLRATSVLPDGWQRHEARRCYLTGGALDAGRPDALIHLAWGGLPNYNSLHHFEQELPAQYALLKLLLASGVTRVVVSGTCFEYGMRSGPLDETMETQPGNPYAFAKDALRRQLEFLQRERPFQLTWARLFYMHGEGQAAGSLLPLLQQAVARGDTRFPMSGGEQLRDYLPVADVARHLVSLAESDTGFGVVNVSSGRPTSVRSLVEGWIAGNGWAIEPELGRFPYPAHEPMAFWGDNQKLRRCLNLH